MLCEYHIIQFVNIWVSVVRHLKQYSSQSGLSNILWVFVIGGICFNKLTFEFHQDYYKTCMMCCLFSYLSAAQGNFGLKFLCKTMACVGKKDVKTESIFILCCISGDTNHIASDIMSDLIKN